MILLKSPTKTILIALLFVTVSSTCVRAETRVYQYDGNLPFVQMMLNMMTTMGILDRLPNNGAYGRRGFNNSPWSRYDTGYGQSDYIWGSPSWGVLPADRYSPYGYPRYSDDMSGWVNESWETSDWNAMADTRAEVKDQSQDKAPIVQNFNYNVPQKSDVDDEKQKVKSPLAKLSRPQQGAEKSVKQNKKRTQSGKNISQPPCVTEFCGLKKPRLDGLWLAQNGEVLGVKNGRYLWSDSKSRYLTGLVKVQNEFLVANIDGYDQLMRFKYKLAGNRLLTVDKTGASREFRRVSADQYNDVLRGYGQGYENYQQY